MGDFEVHNGRVYELRSKDVIWDVCVERQHQEYLKQRGKFAYSCADAEISHFECLAVLAEEVGEVGHVLNESVGGRAFEIAKLREELVQVAAVAVAWVEKVDREIEQYRRVSKELEGSK